MSNRKDLVDLVYRLADDDDLFDFFKEHAYHNEVLADALITRFLPKAPESADVRGEVKRVFENAGEAYGKWGPDMDWHDISSGLYRMMDKARYLRANDHRESAAAIACQIITSVGEEYAKDCVYADDSYDGDDFCTESAVELLIDMAEEGSLSEETIRAVEQEIKEADRMETYEGYCICDFDELLSVLSGYSDSREEHLRILDEKINGFRNPRDRNPWLIRKEAYLRRIGEQVEADRMIERYFSVPEFSRRRIDDEIASGQIQKAIQSLKRAISLEHNPWDAGYLNECHDRLFTLYLQTGDKRGQTEESSWQLVSGHGEVEEIYQRLKALLTREDLRELLASNFDRIKEHRLWYKGEETIRMYASERMIDQVVLLLSVHEYGNNESVYHSLKEHASLLTEEQRKTIVDIHVDALRAFAVETNSKHYSTIRYQMELLRDACQEGADAIRLLTLEFRQKYPRRVAMMAELRRLD